MTADSVDLEECDNHFKGVVGSLFNVLNEDDVTVNSLLNPQFRKLPSAPPVFQNKYTTTMYDLNEMFMPSNYVIPPFETTLDMYNFSEFFEQPLPFETLNPTLEDEEQIRQKIDSFNSYMMPTYENSSHSDVESEIDYFLVSPDAVLPSLHTKEVNIGPLDSMWPELGGLSDEKLVKIMDGGYLENLAMDDILVKKKRRKLTHLDIDHCYSQRLPVEDDYEEDEDEDFFNSSPCSPATSSCSDRLVATRGVKRTRPKRKNVRRKKIKQEVMSSEDEEVDVETPCSVPLVVPKITISISPTLNPPPPRRGRKPKNKSGQNVKKTNNKNYPVPPKVLQAAIQQQKKKCYITKSGRVTKISNSVETTPSTSAPSSISNSRSNSDNEDNVDKRASHNKAERCRRQELTNLFQTLRLQVPKLVNSPKASKVAILTGAAIEVEKLEGGLQEFKNLQSEMKKKVALVQSLLNKRGCSS